jgi:toxin-antitoxin system PIN domain toxin
MIWLPDVNVWIALTSDRHIHHLTASKWLGASKDLQLVFCRITEMGFLRLLTNPHVMVEDVLDAQAAWSVYETWRSDRRVVFMPEPPGFNARWRQASTRITASPNAWTDAYLAAFAEAEQAAVVTFDRRFPQYSLCKVGILSPA